MGVMVTYSLLMDEEDPVRAAHEFWRLLQNRPALPIVVEAETDNETVFTIDLAYPEGQQIRQVTSARNGRPLPDATT